MCRRCDGQPETLGYVLGSCTHTKPQKIRRHGEIKNFLASKLAKNCAVFTEPAVKVLNELKKPDLEVKDQKKLYIIDVTVRL
ncbi:reverse transcriptase [Lasius niger]|uniref:Reverse transcriptase n=1 Tax=Lasius niger TaxID=67767 RepID=A0A0J7P5N0_LASNI|nr:reverse transcriptase [Lasius niger]